VVSLGRPYDSLPLPKGNRNRISEKKNVTKKQQDAGLALRNP
jgi:hypothetical protein